ncbi:hypothetical protein [Nocardioides jensenii]|uniref:hypothetical protein n=1 Tax=Nocardioides jensenii TaxID=1843 RepID=UPI00082C8C54|nr:hypothetical protein [Nocardioides jensenii]
MPFTDPDDWIPALLGGLSAFADAILGLGVVVPGEVAVTGLAVTLDDAQTAPSVVMVALGPVVSATT